MRISPEQAVINAAESEDGITGVFELVVRGVGRRNGRLFLNSRPDYRDPRNLTIVILPAQEQALEDRLGRTLEDAVFGKAIAVRGTAKTVRIDFRDGDTATGLYYFQTQLELQSARDLTVVGEAWFY